ncbi:hypothetical protein [Cumulibacter soli]|uniref:hypothetical protein n=1 Tax=Cumulibacter soli TaxID=2546344 RepID=UPI0010680C55|nr:hypothetical protein [Cumulibacter soli]
MHASYRSSLRVYEPIFAFEGAARNRWARYAARRRRQGSALERERYAMLSAVVGTQVDFHRLNIDEEALIAEWGENIVVCPLDTRDRALQAIVDSEWKLPFPLSDQVLGRTARRKAAGLQLRPKPTEDEGKDHVVTASWEVPFWWALMFTPSDAVPTDTLESIVYRTSIVDALRRGERALELISQTFGVTPFISDLDVAVRWLRTFDLDSMVELDYESLAGLLHRIRPDGDDSMSVAADALEYLQEGDLDSSLASYREYASTWEDVGRLEGWN